MPARFISLLMILFGLQLYTAGQDSSSPSAQSFADVELIVLGTIQDGGFPHIGCDKECCRNIFLRPRHAKKVVSLGLIDHRDSSTWIFEATPDFPTQIKTLKTVSGSDQEIPNGIFLTHAHIGHYTGLMYLGKEAKNAKEAEVYVMPRFAEFLTNNGPWSLLVENGNIKLNETSNETTLKIKEDIVVTPLLVPHRDEFSETVGYRIQGPTKSVLFIPDIDKWHLWDKDIVEEIRDVDYAFLDATFFDSSEVNHRDISEIPHPFVIESMERFKDLPESEKEKIHFIHFNHTNPIIDESSDEHKRVIEAGYNVAFALERIGL